MTELKGTTLKKNSERRGRTKQNLYRPQLQLKSLLIEVAASEMVTC